MSRKVVTAVVWLVVAGPVVALLVWEALPHHHHGPVLTNGGGHTGGVQDPVSELSQ